MDLIENSFVSRGVSLRRMKFSIKHMPLSLSQDLGSYFRDISSSLLRANSIEHLFVLLGPMWNYLNPGLVEFFVGRFGSQDDIAELEKYLEKLDIFRSSVKLGDYVCARHKKNNILEFVQCKSVTTIMSSDWKDRTLLDAERYRIGFGQENHFQQFLPRMDVAPSSIALIVSLPCWVEINLDELAGFFSRNDVKKVFVNSAITEVRNYLTTASIAT